MRTNLKQARKAKDMTQQQVAEHLEISERYYAFLEGGKRNGNFELWDKLEHLFNIHQMHLRTNSNNRLDTEDNR